MKVYLDNAATTPIDPVVADEMMTFIREHYGNPSAVHAYGRKTRAAIEKTRKTIAGLLNCTAAEIYFTSCGTESNNIALQCSVKDYGVKHIISSPVEHSCVSKTVEKMGNNGNCTVHMLDVDHYGRPDMGQLAELLERIGEERALVSLMHANNEIGTMISLEEASEVCARAGAMFHTDTVQTMCHFPIDLEKLKVSFLAGSAHKFHGPKGVGFLYVNLNNKIESLIHGGGQEKALRSGTENVYGIVGMGKAMEIACAEMTEHAEHIRGIKNHMKAKLETLIPDVAFNGDTGEQSLYTVLNVCLPKMEGADMLLFNLDLAGIAASGGSACSSGAVSRSAVLEAIGADPERKSVRFSFSKYTTIEEVDYAAEQLAKFVNAAVSV